jgi:hypothetical protein
MKSPAIDDRAVDVDIFLDVAAQDEIESKSRQQFITL